MFYSIKNSFLCVSVNSRGAELWDICTAGDAPVSCLWDGQEAFWPRRAPVCFPWCGKVDGGWFSADGRRYEAGTHGFVRDMEHRLVEQGADRLRFRLDWTGDRSRWPWPFSFETGHVLEGRSLTTTCTVTNLSADGMPVQLGFHTGLRCPFSPGRGIRDYCIRFQAQESPEGGDCLALTEQLFENDSICLPGLKSEWIQLEELGTGRYLRIATKGYPYVLLWSLPGIPGWVCIEPWTGYPGPGHQLEERPGTILLPPGASFSRAQRLDISV